MSKKNNLFNPYHMNAAELEALNFVDPQCLDNSEKNVLLGWLIRNANPEDLNSQFKIYNHLFSNELGFKIEDLISENSSVRHKAREKFEERLAKENPSKHDQDLNSDINEMIYYELKLFNEPNILPTGEISENID